MVKRAAVLIAIIGLAAAVYWSFHHRAARKQTTNSPAPTVNLTDLGGHAITFASYKGKVVVVNFWAAWCTPCREEIPQFIGLQEKYHSQGFQTVGISMEDPESTLREFCREYKVNYPVIMGNQEIAEEFGGVLGLPTTFVIGRDRRIHGKQVGATDFTKLEQEIAALLQAHD